MNGKVDWLFDAADLKTQPNPSNAYSAQYSIASGVISASEGTTRAYGTCTVYCHSDVQGAGGNGKGGPTKYYNMLTWGGTSTWKSKNNFACGSCHNAGGTSHTDNLGDKITSGSHTRHSRDYNNWYNCSICHFGIAGLGSCGVNCHGAEGQENKHVNGFVDINFNGFTDSAISTYSKTIATSSSDGDKGYLPGSGYASCSNVSCHNDGTSLSTGTLVSIKTPTWGLDGQCDACHGNGTGAGMPNYDNGNPKANSHEAHKVYQCNKCHYTDYSKNCSNGAL